MRVLLFELRFPDGKVARLYSDGAHEGLPDGTLQVNYANAVLDALVATAVPSAEDRAMLESIFGPLPRSGAAEGAGR